MIFVNDTKGKIGKVLNITNDSTKFGLVQADTTHGNEPNMSDSKALKQEKKIGHLDDPQEVAQRVQYVFL